MSSFALSGMRRLEFSEIVAKRRADFQFWLEWFAKIDGIIPLFDSLPSGVCPLGFPVLVRDRTRWRTRLEQVGLLIRIHWHLPTSVGREFVNSHRLADESLTLPLYPEFSRKQREQVTALKKSVSNSVLLNV